MAGGLEKEAKRRGEAMRGCITGTQGGGQGPAKLWEVEQTVHSGGSRVVLCLTAAVVLLLAAVVTACGASGPHGNNAQTAALGTAAPRAAAPTVLAAAG